MCGRFVATETKEQIAERFGIRDVSAVPALTPSYNLPPSKQAYVVGFNPEAKRRGLSAMTWGFVPRWWKKSLKEAIKPANATAEGIAEKPFFRDSFRKRRCIVPVSGFYEWKKGEGAGPFFIRPAEDDVFAFAGIWDHWKSPEGEGLFTFAIATTTPNDLMAEIHNRMPVILPKESWEAWLASETSVEEAKSLLVPYPPERMTALRVSTLVNSPKNNRPELTAPAA